MRIKLVVLFTIMGIVISFSLHPSAFAVIDGPCVNCHTMHNSQDGTSMNFDNSVTPNELLLRADCLGCHARGINQNIDPANGAPQVLHTNATDLAGGNFNYILGGKGSGASDAKGHNVIELGNNDDDLTDAPGRFHADTVLNTELTCAGWNGCHGLREFDETGSGLPSIKGAHHDNTEGKCETDVDTVGGAYRFLYYVKGLEDSDWQATVGATDHNEYFGATTPLIGDDCTECHNMALNSRTYATNSTISGFCATCHGNFHVLESFLGDPGIGGNTSSPFKRHPTDVVLPSSGEYANYTAYSLEAPVARPTVYDTPSDTVTPGTDIVMCLSCHSSHGTDYLDILRWDYTDMIAGDSSKSGGCFACHTQKNQ
jgi:predicted CXXCH cytochrome family protein